ncbi:hypothetical protein FTO68_03610 [Methanocalculus taiwanensis]|uniref:Uncharacterized protein n=1 Tax=Methanocalculus taiwanensis TaxID=106207 RepID=A0ABD4TGH6_9EURY|nr:hypothetical protein [Methanocalculus taiwanensis]MCQ1538078.1 hypothetical protein [Methanocalculus taiwanensis]
MPEVKKKESRSGSLADCIQTAIEENFSGTIGYRAGNSQLASLIFVRGEPAGAEYADSAGTIYGDVAVLRLPVAPGYFAFPLSEEEAIKRAARARIYHPERLLAHASVKDQKSSITGTGQPGIGVVTIIVKGGTAIKPGLRIELWNEGRICATDALDQHGRASFRLLKGEYECRLREGIRLVSTTTISYPGGDMEIPLSIDGAGG